MDSLTPRLRLELLRPGQWNAMITAQHLVRASPLSCFGSLVPKSWIQGNAWSSSWMTVRSSQNLAQAAKLVWDKLVWEGCNGLHDVGLSQVSCRSCCRASRGSNACSMWRIQEGRKSNRWRVPASDTSPQNTAPRREEFEFGRNSETEEEARIRNWKENGWAPWEELRSPEAQFAVDTVQAAGMDEPVVSEETFRKLDQKYYYAQLQTKLDEMAKKADEELMSRLQADSAIYEQLLMFSLIPPRDWPPPGWKVDAKELAYIREAHALENVRVDPSDLVDSNLQPEGKKMHTPRWDTFLKQYNEWKAANKELMDQEALEVDEEYYPGRRRTGEEYEENMYELPFIYPGQHYFGVVTSISLYEGAFVYFGGVHDGWVPIMDNDWYEIRKFIRVGMRVHVEVIAKRDPYRFRFPVEMRFVVPNIDHLIFRRFKYPPIFGRAVDTNLDEVARESGRPFYPKLRPEAIPEDEEGIAPVHPYIRRLWMVHEAEKIELEAESGIDDGDWDYWDFPEENDTTGEWTNEPGLVHQCLEGVDIPMIIVPIEDKYLDLEAARAERKVFMNLAAEAHARGEDFHEPDGRFKKRMKELNDMHQKRWTEQKEALLRDRTCRLELGLPLEEPGRYADKSFWGKNPYDPREPQWRSDYWGDSTKLNDELRKDRLPKSRNEGVIVSEVGDESKEVIFVDEAVSTEDGIAVETERRAVQRTTWEADLKLIFGESDETETSSRRPVRTINLFGDTSNLGKGFWNGLDEDQRDGGEDLEATDEN